MADDDWKNLSEEEKLRAIAYVRGSGKCRGKRTRMTLSQQLRRNLRRDQVQRLTAEGKDEKQVAAALGISASTVQRDIRFANVMAIRSMLANRVEALGTIRARLLRLMGEMEISFELSKNGEVIEKRGERPGEQGGHFEETVYKPNEAGDRGYIETLNNLLKQCLDTYKLEIDPRFVGDLKATPDLLFLECGDRDDVAVYEDIVSMREAMGRLHTEGEDPEATRGAGGTEDMDAL
jgi:hypothetical protein